MFPAASILALWTIKVYLLCLPSAGLPGFRIVIIWETFHCLEKYPVIKTLLNMWVIALIPIPGNSFKILPVIRSCPLAFFESNCFIADHTSGSFNFLIGVTSRPGVSRACRISRSSSSGISEFYGLKTFVKCPASTFAFLCISFCPFSLFSSQSGGTGVCGRFSFLVAFHSEYSVADKFPK